MFIEKGELTLRGPVWQPVRSIRVPGDRCWEPWSAGEAPAQVQGESCGFWELGRY